MPILFNIDMWIHVVTDEAAAQPSSPDYITDDMITAQVAYLQTSFATGSIAFNFLGTTRVINATWAANGDDKSMRAALRRGNYATLNLFFQSQYQAAASTPGLPAGSILLGLGSLPVYGIAPNASPASYSFDGVSLRSGVIAGGTVPGYNNGFIVAHEIGHWFGLLHTFQGNTCSNTSYGDRVFDTPQQQFQGSGCPPPQQSCTGSGVTLLSPVSSTPFGPQGLTGPDANDNFMDYTNAKCLKRFTRGQALRMFNSVQLYREGR